MAVPVDLSQRAFDRLKAEYDDLTTRGRVDIARKIETARELGDLSENGDYHAAKEEQGKMDLRMRQILHILEDAEIVDVVDTDKVALGTTVSIRYDGDDEVEEYLIGSIEERHPGVTVISPSSPLGQAVLGHREGDTVEYDAPGGRLKVEIIEISLP